MRFSHRGPRRSLGPLRLDRWLQSDGSKPEDSMTVVAYWSSERTDKGSRRHANRVTRRRASTAGGYANPVAPSSSTTTVRSPPAALNWDYGPLARGRCPVRPFVTLPIFVEAGVWGYDLREHPKASRAQGTASSRVYMTSPSSSRRRSRTRRARQSWQRRGEGSSPPPTRRAAGSSETSTTESSSG